MSFKKWNIELDVVEHVNFSTCSCISLFRCAKLLCMQKFMCCCIIFDDIGKTCFYYYLDRGLHVWFLNKQILNFDISEVLQQYCIQDCSSMQTLLFAVYPKRLPHTMCKRKKNLTLFVNSCYRLLPV